MYFTSFKCESRAAVTMRTSGKRPSTSDTPSGAATMHPTTTAAAPRSIHRATTWPTLPPVASIGSRTTTNAPETSPIRSIYQCASAVVSSRASPANINSASGHSCSTALVNARPARSTGTTTRRPTGRQPSASPTGVVTRTASMGIVRKHSASTIKATRCVCWRKAVVHVS